MSNGCFCLEHLNGLTHDSSGVRWALRGFSLELNKHLNKKRPSLVSSYYPSEASKSFVV